MDKEEATRQLTEYLRGDVGYLPDPPWIAEGVELSAVEDGNWLAKFPGAPDRGVLLRPDGSTIPFFGALGRLVCDLGLPVSREYFLGSTRQGRYQSYDRGLAIWEEFEGGHNLGYPIARWHSIARRARSCQALIAFFDLRGFTGWSGSAQVDPARIQDVVEKLERSFQDAFAREWCQKIFAKGTGDGFMIVSEAGSYALGGYVNETKLQVGHAEAFCRACADTVRRAVTAIPQDIAVGCGITAGEIAQVYLLGRYDYIGLAVNDASKIQSAAYNELCLSPDVQRCLEADSVRVSGRMLPGKGLRVTYESLVEADSGTLPMGA